LTCPTRVTNVARSPAAGVDQSPAPFLVAIKAAAALHMGPISSDQVALRIRSEKMGVCRKGQRPPTEDALENARRVEELGVKPRVIASDRCVFHLVCRWMGRSIPPVSAASRFHPDRGPTKQPPELSFRLALRCRFLDFPTEWQCPLNVDSSRQLRANTAHSSSARRTVKSTRRRHSCKLPVSAAGRVQHDAHHNCGYR